MFYNNNDDIIKKRKGIYMSNQLRVASFNIASSLHPDIQKINQLFKDLQIDFVGLQEVDIHTKRNPFNMMESFNKLKEYPFMSFYQSIDFENGKYGIGCLSKLPMIEKTGGALYSETLEEKRVWQRNVIQFNHIKIAIYNTHLTHENKDIRKRQMEELLNLLNNDPIEYKILTGDFNIDYDKKEILMMTSDYNIVNGYLQEWFNTYLLYDEKMENYAIDNIIYSKNIKMNNVKVVESELSDHALLYADFEIIL